MKQTYTVLTDDLDGTEASVTVRFAYQGKYYSIDLSEANAEAFATLIGRYIAAARQEASVSNTIRASYKKQSSHRHIPYDPKKVRDWAIRTGHNVGERGRISHDILEAYLAGIQVED